jgi:hypothetical protein
MNVAMGRLGSKNSMACNKERRQRSSARKGLEGTNPSVSIRVERKSVVDPGWLCVSPPPHAHQDEQVARSDGNADPTVGAITHVEIASSLEHKADLFVFVQMSSMRQGEHDMKLPNSVKKMASFSAMPGVSDDIFTCIV